MSYLHRTIACTLTLHGQCAGRGFGRNSLIPTTPCQCPCHHNTNNPKGLPMTDNTPNDNGQNEYFPGQPMDEYQEGNTPIDFNTWGREARCVYCNKPVTADDHGTLVDNTGGDVCGSYGTFTNEPHVLINTSGDTP